MADRHPHPAPDRLAVDGLPHPLGRAAGRAAGRGHRRRRALRQPHGRRAGQRAALPGYALFDAAIFYSAGRHWRLALNGTNLANREVISGCYDATRCIYANGRTVLATAKYAW
nr:TonB-dependent receptor [Ralstonia sp. RS650]